VLRGLGWRGARLERIILDRVTVLSPEAIDTIVTYIDNINFTGIGVFGAVFLFVTFVSTVTTVESAFNAIWDHAPARTLGRRITDYFGVMVVAPVLLAVAVSLTAAVQSNAAYGLLMQTWGVGAAARAALPYAAWVAVCVLVAFLYVFVPNTRVRLLPATIGGVLAGSIWQLTHWAYLRFQIGLQGYNAVYGTLAQLPLLMVWMYLSWVIVLLGAETAWAIQTVAVYSRERRAASKSGQTFREWIALAITVELAQAAEERTDAPTTEDLSQRFDVPLRTIRDIVMALCQCRIAHTTGSPKECCYLSLAPERIAVTRVLEAVRGTLPPAEAHSISAESAVRARELLEEMIGAAKDSFGGRTLRDVVLSASRAQPSGPRVVGVQRAGFGTARKDHRPGGE
jgi:membrane protein